MYLQGPIPTIASYNASVVKIYNATSSLERFGNKIFYSTFMKIALGYCNTGDMVVGKFISRRIGSCCHLF
jgi:hypothetical protein